MRERDVHRMRWWWWLLAAIVIAATPFTAYLLEQMEFVRTRYKIEELRSQHERLVEMEQRLRIERATLQNPDRVERCAVRDLELQHPSPRRVVVVQRPEGGQDHLLARAPASRP